MDVKLSNDGPVTIYYEPKLTQLPKVPQTKAYTNKI
jgi:hypothetical protein